MSLLQYGPKASRVPLALQLIQLLDESDRRGFWQAFGKNDTVGFATVMERVLEKLQHFHEQAIYHDRTVQLLGDALRWGIQNPAVLLEGGRHPGDSPNMVAFTQIVSLFHQFHESTGARVTTFIHDEQNQFAKSLTNIYGLIKGFSLEQPNLIAPLPEVKRALTFGCDLQVRSSHGCIGLQLVDVALWLTKRFVESDGAIHGSARSLVLFIINNAMTAELTRQQMIRDAEAIVSEIMTHPITAEREREGRKLLADIEAKRVARMNGPAEAE